MPRPESATLRQLTGLATELFGSRADLQARFGEIDSLGFWIWLMSEGMQESPEIADLFPIPPSQLMGRVVGAAATDEFFRTSGLDQAREFYKAFADAGVDVGQIDSLLDFGCGCGRILRFFSRFAHSCDLVGVDIDEEAVAWNTANTDYASFAVVPPAPPTGLADEQFDAVYAYSVFTHLPEALHLAWLEELRRVTKPGGVLTVTTHGQHLVDRALRGELAPLDNPPEEVAADLPQLERDGFLFYPYRFERPWMPDEYDANYGMTFILEPYVRETWGQLFEIVAYTPAPSDYQDLVVLRDPAKPTSVSFAPGADDTVG